MYSPKTRGAILCLPMVLGCSAVGLVFGDPRSLGNGKEIKTQRFASRIRKLAATALISTHQKQG